MQSLALLVRLQRLSKMKKFYDRHDKVALLFSGGKDSLACLYMCKPYWDKTEVVWVDTGKNFPEIEEFMEEVKAMVPNFVKITTHQDNFVKAYGYPSDVVPTKCDINGRNYGHAKVRQPMVSKYHCCANNIWHGIEQYMTSTDATGFIKGQRFEDDHQAPWVKHFCIGSIDREMFYPVANMTETDVLRYLLKQGVELTKRFMLSHSSLDCWDCMAYWEHLPERLEYMQALHPEKYEHVVKILENIKLDIADDVKLLP